RANVFGIRVGVAVSFFVKKHRSKGCRLRYSDALATGSAEDKLIRLHSFKLDDGSFLDIKPTKTADWLTEGVEPTDDLIPIGNKSLKVKSERKASGAAFQFFSLGVVTARDEWVYDYNAKALETKVRQLIAVYEVDRKRFGGHFKKLTKAEVGNLDYGIKWTRA